MFIAPTWQWFAVLGSAIGGALVAFLLAPADLAVPFSLGAGAFVLLAGAILVYVFQPDHGP